MKSSVVMAVAAAGVASAQALTPSPILSYIPPSGGAVTPLPIVTGTTTYTYCPACVHYTTWVTEYSVFCPTGLAPHPYTITESCTGSVPTFTPHPPEYIPPGFTTTVGTCTVCGPTPVTATLTCPPAGPTPYVPPGMTTPAPCPGEGCPGVPEGHKPPTPYSPCPGGPNCPAPAPAPVPAPAPAPAPAPVPAPAPAPAPAPLFMPPSNTTFTPYKGAASTNAFQLTGLISSFIAIGFVAALL